MGNPTYTANPEATRRFERRPVQTSSPVLDTRTGNMINGRSRDLSHGGIFIETPTTDLPVGTCIEVFVGGVGVGVQIFGRVVHIVPGIGFGAAFTEESGALSRLL
jgi:hypothetical protein